MSEASSESYGRECGVRLELLEELAEAVVDECAWTISSSVAS